MTREVTFDVAIIGGGVIGLSIARALAVPAEGARLRVCVVDARSVAPPATRAAAGMLAPSFENVRFQNAGAQKRADATTDDNERALALLRLSLRSLDLWPSFAAALEEETATSIDFQANGVIAVGMDDVQLHALARAAEPLRAQGRRADLLSADEVKELEPALSASVCGGVFAPDDAQVDPRLLLSALRTQLGKSRTTLFPARVCSLKKQHRDVSLSLETGETISAARVIMASGAALSLARDIAVPIVPVKGEAMALSGAGDLVRRVVRGPGAYLCPKADARMVIGATEYEGASDEIVDGDAINALRDRAQAVVPSISTCREIERWAGVRPGTPDGAPVLGYAPGFDRQLLCALGHYRNGVLLAPATAAMIAAEILQPGSQNFSEFSPNRFAAHPYA